MTRCRIPEFEERHKLHIGINDNRSKRILLEVLIRKLKVFTFIMKHDCVIWKKIKKGSFLKGWMS